MISECPAAIQQSREKFAAAVELDYIEDPLLKAKENLADKILAEHFTGPDGLLTVAWDMRHGDWFIRQKDGSWVVLNMQMVLARMFPPGELPRGIAIEDVAYEIEIAALGKSTMHQDTRTGAWSLRQGVDDDGYDRAKAIPVTVPADWRDRIAINRLPSQEEDAGTTLSRAALNLAALSHHAAPEREWLVDGLIPAGNVTLLHGDGGTGKSLLAMQLAVATALGGQWLGLPVAQGPALYLTAEDDADELHRRIADIASDEDATLADLHGKLNVISLVADDPALAVADRNDRLKATSLWKELVATVKRDRPKLVILDTVADTFAGNENVRLQVRGFVAMLRKLAVTYGAAVVPLAHPSRAGLATAGLNAGAGSSGSTAWHNSVRSRLLLTRGDDRDPDLRTLKAVKANYGRAGDEIKMRWTNGVFQVIGKTIAGKDPEAEAEAERVFLECLDAYTADGRRVGSSPGRNFAPALFAADERSGMFDKRDLAAAMNRLFAKGEIKTIEDGPPSKRRERIVRAAPAG